MFLCLALQLNTLSCCSFDLLSVAGIFGLTVKKNHQSFFGDFEVINKCYITSLFVPG